MKKYLDVLVDVETLSLRSTAAIIQIAAKTFTLDGSKTKEFTDDKKTESHFVKNVNATTCAMYGMSFDQGTIEWWSKQEAKENFKTEWGEPISYVLSEFNEWLEQWQKDSKADELMIWTQGTDFDIAVLRNAYRVVFGDEKSIPWHFRNVRDARTYFLETARVFEPNVEDPYSLIDTKGTVHNALADCEWSIKAVQWAYNKIVRNGTD